MASIAVLPFVNRSASADDEYFSDGLADELLDVLAKIGGLRVAARTSAFHFKGKDTTIAEVGRRLNVASVLEGSVRKAGNRVRISVQLVKVADGFHVWSETYDRTLDDIFAVQDDIAQSVVKELRATLLGEETDPDASGRAKAEVERATQGRGTDPEAHRLFLLARYLLDRWSREDTAKAVGYLKEALDRDPAHALAWAELSRAYAGEAHLGWVAFTDGYERAREAADRALALNRDLAEAHARKAWIRVHFDHDFEGADALYTRALELSPGNADVLRGAGVLAWTLGRIDDAVALYHRALEQDPLSPPGYYNLGIVLHSADRLTESEEAYRKALALAPQGSATGRAHHAVNLLALGHGEEALKEAQREPEERSRLWALAIVHHATHRQKESDAALDELIEKHSADSAYWIAEVYGARGEVDKAFEWLAHPQALRDNGHTKTSPRLQTLHRDPRWGSLMTRLGLGV